MHPGSRATTGGNAPPGGDARGPFIVGFGPLFARRISMAKVSWNKTWALKMRKKSRGKKGKNKNKKS
jgi:hypothetical protein